MIERRVLENQCGMRNKEDRRQNREVNGGKTDVIKKKNKSRQITAVTASRRGGGSEERDDTRNILVFVQQRSEILSLKLPSFVCCLPPTLIRPQLLSSEDALITTASDELIANGIKKSHLNELSPAEFKQAPEMIGLRSHLSVSLCQASGEASFLS